MRIIIFVLLIAAAGVGGFLVYKGRHSEAPRADLFTPPAATPAPTHRAEACEARNAVYEFADDRRLMLRFRLVPSAAANPSRIEVVEAGHGRASNLLVVVQATSFGADYVFQPVNSFLETGPDYLRAERFVQPQGGGPRMLVHAFDSDMHAVRDLPRHDSPAPAYIAIDGLMPRLMPHRIDLPAGMFRFQSCDTPTPAPAP